MKIAEYMKVRRPVGLAGNLLLFLTPPVIAAFVYIFAILKTTGETELAFRLYEIRDMLEYAFAGLLALFCGALVADIAEIDCAMNGA